MIVERRRVSRTAGFLWLLMWPTSATWGLLSVPRLFVVRGDAAATAQAIREAETLFRACIASEMVYATLFLFLGLTFYSLLKDVQRDWARALVLLVAAGSGVAFLNSLNLALPLILVRGGSTLEAFTPAQLEQLAYAFLRLRADGTSLLTWFLGLWLVPAGMLVVRSGFFPRVIGYAALYGGVAHAAYAVVCVVAPASGPTFFRYVTLPSGVLGEVPFLLWLLIRGADRADGTITAVENESPGRRG